MPNIIEKVEQKRGCGYRQEGGLYLVSEGAAGDCGKLPFPLTVCPCCRAGIKPTRGWTWVDSTALMEGHTCRFTGISDACRTCPLKDNVLGRVGLLWVGEAFYKTPGDFLKEAAALGVSRRIPAVPVGFKVGETWVMLAHRKACEGKGSMMVVPGVFRVFKPSRIEYVVKSSDPLEKLEKLEKRGLTLVWVTRAPEAKPVESAPLLEYLESKNANHGGPAGSGRV
jgi:hypothetical protein